MHITERAMDEKKITFNRLIDRFTDELADQLKKVYAHIKEAGEWNIQFRPDNKIFMYYKGNALVLKIYKDSKNFSISSTNKILKKEAKEIDESMFANKKARPIREMAELLLEKKWLDTMARVIIEHDSIDKEKEIEQQIIAGLEENEEFLIIDMEIRIPGHGYKSDMLGLKKGEGNTYRFIPIELKLSGDECCTRMRKDGEERTAVGQACEFCKVLKENTETFITHYKKILKDKQKIGMFPGIKDIEISAVVMDPVVLVIGDLINDRSKSKLEWATREKEWEKWDTLSTQGCADCKDVGKCAVQVRNCTVKEFIRNPLGEK